MTNEPSARKGDGRPDETLHTPGGMTGPAEGGRSADGADIASTDTSTGSPNTFGEPEPPRTPRPGASAVLEPAEEAVRRLEDELDGLKDRHARLAAEFDNYRKRVTRERAELNDRAQAALVMRLLDVLDDMDRLAAGDIEATPLPALREAVTMVDRKLRKELEAAGIERVDPIGQPFDPTRHEAVSIVPPPAPEQDHQVSATLQVGYLFKGNLIRPARVQVFSTGGQA